MLMSLEERWGLIKLRIPCTARDQTLFMGGRLEYECSIRRGLGLKNKIKPKDCLKCRLVHEEIRDEIFNPLAHAIKKHNEKMGAS